MHAVGLATVFTCQSGNFCGGDDEGFVVFGNVKGIADVVEVGMTDEDVVSFYVLRFESFRIPFKEGVEEHGVSVMFQTEAGVVDKVKISHSENVLPKFLYTIISESVRIRIWERRFFCC